MWEESESGKRLGCKVRRKGSTLTDISVNRVMSTCSLYLQYCNTAISCYSHDKMLTMVNVTVSVMMVQVKFICSSKYLLNINSSSYILPLCPLF